MQHKYIDFRQFVYDNMMGYTEAPASVPIKNEFEENSHCSRMLEKIYLSQNHLSALLNDEDSPEVNLLIDTFYAMQEYLCKKMFDYGVYFQKNRSLPPEITPEEVAECLYKK